ncbi:MAG TPA: hypothetical protein ENG66_09675 [Thermococcus sp.]|nr:hypothetical protein [Thermococcus sp.]
MDEEQEIEFEEEINEWITSIDTGSYTPSVSIDFKKRKVTIQLCLKLGDGCDMPYSDLPIDKSIVKGLERHKWKVELDGSLIYPRFMICARCGVVPASSCSSNEEGEYYHSCGSPVIDYLRGAKWIYAYKTISFSNPQEIKEKIQKAIDKLFEVRQELKIILEAPAKTSLEVLPILLNEDALLLSWLLRECGPPQKKNFENKTLFYWHYYGEPIYNEETKKIRVVDQLLVPSKLWRITVIE